MGEAVAAGLQAARLVENDLTHTPADDAILPSSSVAVVAVPVYRGSVAPLALERLQGLHGDGTPVVLLAVYGNRDYEHALDDLDRFMTERGFVTVAAGTFVGEHSYSTPQTPVAAGRPDVADLQLARRFGEKVRDKLAGYEPGRFVRLEVARIPRPELSWLDKLRFVWYGLGLKVSKKPMPVAPVTDPGQCNGCGVCAIVCPTGAIAAGNELHTLLRLCEELPPDGPFVRYPVCKNPHRLLCTAQAAACTVVNCKLLIVSQWQLMKCEGPVQYRPLLLRKAEYQQADSFPFPGNNKMWIT